MDVPVKSLLVHFAVLTVIGGLTVDLIVVSASAANRNPWKLYRNDQPIGGASGSTTSNSSIPLPAWQTRRNAAPLANRQYPPGQALPPSPQQPLPLQPVPRQYGNEYAPMPQERAPTSRQPWEYSPQRQPNYRYAVPGYGYNTYRAPGGFYGGWPQGQFGFGMSMSPGLGFSGMPNGFGYPAVPYGGGGFPFGGMTPFGWGMPMF